MSKIIIFGASGFVGRALIPLLNKINIPYIAPASKTIDLSAPDAAQKIGDITQDGDSIIMLSALTPEKGDSGDLVIKNIMMAKNIATGIAQKKLGHFVYVSSDAVYPLTADVVDERTSPLPYSLYGHMHAMREQFFKECLPLEKLTLIRPCAIYGEGDTHNAYGINRFIRSAEEQGEIVLFGEGEEYRDHVHVDDVAALIFAAWQQKTAGIFNAASGKSWRFADIASTIQSRIGKKVSITHKPRAMPVFHRHVDISTVCSAFPSCLPRSIGAGIEQLLGRSLAA